MSKAIVHLTNLTNEELHGIVEDLERRGCSEHAAELESYRKAKFDPFLPPFSPLSVDEI